MLMLASYGGHVTSCAALLVLRADLHARNAWDCDVGHFAALGGSVDMCRWLLAQGLSLERPQSSGHTALHKAQEAGQQEVVRFLEANAKPTVPGESGSEQNAMLGFMWTLSFAPHAERGIGAGSAWSAMAPLGRARVTPETWTELSVLALQILESRLQLPKREEVQVRVEHRDLRSKPADLVQWDRTVERSSDMVPLVALAQCAMPLPERDFSPIRPPAFALEPDLAEGKSLAAWPVQASVSLVRAHIRARTLTETKSWSMSTKSMFAAHSALAVSPLGSTNVKESRTTFRRASPWSSSMATRQKAMNKAMHKVMTRDKAVLKICAMHTAQYPVRAIRTASLARASEITSYKAKGTCAPGWVPSRKAWGRLETSVPVQGFSRWPLFSSAGVPSPVTFAPTDKMLPELWTVMQAVINAAEGRIVYLLGLDVKCPAAPTSRKMVPGLARKVATAPAPVAAAFRPRCRGWARSGKTPPSCAKGGTTSYEAKQSCTPGWVPSRKAWGRPEACVRPRGFRRWPLFSSAGVPSPVTLAPTDKMLPELWRVMQAVINAAEGRIVHLLGLDVKCPAPSLSFSCGHSAPTRWERIGTALALPRLLGRRTWTGKIHAAEGGQKYYGQVAVTDNSASLESRPVMDAASPKSFRSAPRRTGLVLRDLCIGQPPLSTLLVKRPSKSSEARLLSSEISLKEQAMRACINAMLRLLVCFAAAPAQVSEPSRSRADIEPLAGAATPDRTVGLALERRNLEADSTSMLAMQRGCGRMSSVKLAVLRCFPAESSGSGSGWPRLRRSLLSTTLCSLPLEKLQATKKLKEAAGPARSFVTMVAKPVTTRCTSRTDKSMASSPFARSFVTMVANPVTTRCTTRSESSATSSSFTRCTSGRQHLEGLWHQLPSVYGPSWPAAVLLRRPHRAARPRPQPQAEEEQRSQGAPVPVKPVPPMKSMASGRQNRLVCSFVASETSLSRDGQRAVSHGLRLPKETRRCSFLARRRHRLAGRE
ncbi:unnamed protein product [Effrenium voratum]|nr:unnamed protein product [Effrenium voratum]